MRCREDQRFFSLDGPPADNPWSSTFSNVAALADLESADSWSLRDKALGNFRLRTIPSTGRQNPANDEPLSPKRLLRGIATKLQQGRLQQEQARNNTAATYNVHVVDGRLPH